MTVYRCILAPWAADKEPAKRRVYEGQFSEETILQLNEQFYNIYYLPNYPSLYIKGEVVDGSQIDTFEYVFVDMDLKDGVYSSKMSFINQVKTSFVPPTRIVDSGGGVHVYWKVSDLDAMNFLRLQRRLMRKFNTDEAVAKIYQLMRVPGTVNTKREEDLSLCEILEENPVDYTCEELDSNLPPLSPEDDEYCSQHLAKTYKLGDTEVMIDDKLPLKFSELMRQNSEVKLIWTGNTSDRSKADYRLGFLMHANGFTRQEALSVLVNTAKALSRAPIHRHAYAVNIVDKIWTDAPIQLDLSNTVKEILQMAGDELKGTRFRCWSYLDNTEHGFRLGQVIGLIAGSGVGKTAIALNMFQGFVQSNPEYDHFFIPLEQPPNEIADRWRAMCGDNVSLHEKVHVISNYDKDGSFRHLSFDDIKDYLLKFKEKTGRAIGCVVIDHIAALRKKGKNGENQDLMDICHAMKAFAIQTNTMLVMQSQAPREKAGIGDLELNKDAAYGTVYFESYCDYLITLWQPLKRCYAQGAPTVTAFKFCKIRHKRQNKDVIKEDVCYRLMFDPNTGHLREFTQEEDKSFPFWLGKATNERKKDRKADLVEYTSVRWEGSDGVTKNNTDTTGTGEFKTILGG